MFEGAKSSLVFVLTFPVESCLTPSGLIHFSFSLLYYFWTDNVSVLVLTVFVSFDRVCLLLVAAFKAWWTSPGKQWSSCTRRTAASPSTSPPSRTSRTRPTSSPSTKSAKVPYTCRPVTQTQIMHVNIPRYINIYKT